MLGLALRRTAIAAGVMASDRSNLRQELASVAAVTAGVSGTPRPPGFRSGGEGEDALDQKRHDRSSARPRANVKATHVLDPAEECTQRGTAAQAAGSSLRRLTATA